MKDRVRRPVIAFARADATARCGLGALRAGHPHPRRARCDRHAPSRTHREVRRPRDGGGPHAASETSWIDFARAFDEEVRALDERRGADRRRDRTASSASTRCALERRGACARRALGPGVSGAGFDGCSCPHRAHRRRAASEDVGGGRADRPHFDAIAFMHFDEDDAPDVPPEARVQLVYRLDINEYKGERAAAARRSPAGAVGLTESRLAAGTASSAANASHCALANRDAAMEINLLKRHSKTSGSASALQGVSLSTTTRRNASKKSAASSKIPPSGTSPSEAQELGRERARLRAGRQHARHADATA